MTDSGGAPAWDAREAADPRLAARATNSSRSAAPLDVIAALLRHAPRAMLLVDPDGTVQVANAAAETLAAQLSPGRSILDLAGDEPAEIRDGLRMAARSTLSIPLGLYIADRWRPFVAWRTDPIPPETAPLVMLKATPEHDFAARLARARRETTRATERLTDARAERARLIDEARRLRDMAERDRMTGLLNASAFAEKCQARLHDRMSGVLIFADLDHFKTINDRFGHEAGDHVLGTVSDRLQAEVRRRDLVGRLGGDEFALWLDEQPEDQVPALLERLERAVRQPIFWRPAANRAQVSLAVGVTLGWAPAGREGMDMMALRAQADADMYAGKSARRRA